MMNISDIEHMTRSEKLQAMEALWDSLLQEDNSMEAPAWHNAILEQRKLEMASGRARFLSLDELKARRRQ